jgi:cell division protein FtsQ
VLALPRGGGGLVHALPSPRSLLVGLAVFAAAVAAYFGALESPLFAVRTIVVRGASPAVRAQVLAALRPTIGGSLLKVDGGTVDRRLASVPWVSSASFDRDFPHTLVVTVRPERPVAVLRRGAASWLVSARGRVLQTLRRRARLDLPRIWVPHKASVAVGDTLGTDDGGREARALAPLALVRFPVGVASVTATDDQLTFLLRTGVQLRLGDPSDLRLKLAIARRVLKALPVAAGGYVDVSVPQRPVALPYPQLGG